MGCHSLFTDVRGLDGEQVTNQITATGLHGIIISLVYIII